MNIITKTPSGINRFSYVEQITQCLGAAGRLARGGGRRRGSCSEIVSQELRACRRAGSDAQSVLACLERSMGL